MSDRTTADASPPEHAKVRLDRLRFKVPVMLGMAGAAVRDARRADAAAQIARARRVGRDDGLRQGRDYGPGIRLVPIRARGQREALRQADVVVEDGPDPERPNRTTRRAKRLDPLIALRDMGAVTKRQVEAAELLRSQLEASPAAMPSASQCEIHTAPFGRGGPSDWQLKNCTWARKAIAAMAAVDQPVVLWVVVGGTIRGFARWRRCRHTTASRMLSSGLDALADHYLGPVT
jgi:hypothetical protein